MFNRDSFSSQSFSENSWLFDVITSVTRFVMRLQSRVLKVFVAKSEVK